MSTPAAQKRFYERHKERILATRRAQQAARTPEQREADLLARRAYWQKTRVARHAQQRQQRQLHQEKLRKQKAASDRRCRARIRNTAAAWRRRNVARLREKRRIYLWNLRLEMIVAYGGACQCCGESAPHFLSIDHIHNDGNQERAGRKHMTGMRFYFQLRKRGWPRDRYQLLCYNCNFGKAHYGGVCPHQQPTAQEKAG